MSVTARDYFRTQASAIGITMSDEQLDAFALSAKVNGDDYITPDNVEDADRAFLGIILRLLIMPDVSEDDFSIKYDRASVQRWVNAECARLDVKNIALGPVVKDMSFLA